MKESPASLPHSLPDSHQNALHLSMIQLVGMISLPVVSTSVLLLTELNFYSALLAILLGNFLLFFIRLGILSMSFVKKQSALDIAKEYLGSVGGYFIAILLLLATIAWFVVQTTLATNTLVFLLPVYEGADINIFMQYSVVLGVLSTLLCMEGMIVLRYLSIIAFPILLVTFAIIVYVGAPSFSLPPLQTLSFSGITLVLATSLGVSVDLPTFFRHSKSWKDSFNALIIIQIVSIILGVAGLYLSTIISPWFGIKESNPLILASTLLRASLIILTFISVIAANVANVYSASVAWELVAPILAGRKEYLILGLGLTVIFILITNILSLDSLLTLTDTSLVNLCLVLVITYTLLLLLRRPLTLSDKIGAFTGWLLSTILNTYQYLHSPTSHHATLPAALALILLSSLISATIGTLKKK
jgi:purine-cytosine permease-like protein